MTNEQPACGSATGLDEIKQHIRDVQHRACLLTGLIEAMNFIDNEGRCDSGRTAVALMAEDLAFEVSNSLESIETKMAGGKA